MVSRSSLPIPHVIIGVLWLVLTGVPACAFIVTGEEGRVVQQLIDTEILPLFEQSAGLVFGIEDLDISQDPADLQVRVWVFTIVLTVNTPTGPSIVQEELTFRGRPGELPRLSQKTSAVPWPQTASLP
jgi:hypothetical protein